MGFQRDQYPQSHRHLGITNCCSGSAQARIDNRFACMSSTISPRTPMYSSRLLQETPFFLPAPLQGPHQLRSSSPWVGPWCIVVCWLKGKTQLPWLNSCTNLRSTSLLRSLMSFWRFGSNTMVSPRIENPELAEPCLLMPRLAEPCLFRPVISGASPSNATCSSIDILRNGRFRTDWVSIGERVLNGRLEINK